MLTALQRQKCNETVWWTITNPELIFDAFVVLKLDMPIERVRMVIADNLRAMRTLYSDADYYNDYYNRLSLLESLRHHTILDFRNLAKSCQEVTPRQLNYYPDFRRCRPAEEIIKRLPVVKRIVDENPVSLAENICRIQAELERLSNDMTLWECYAATRSSAAAPTVWIDESNAATTTAANMEQLRPYYTLNSWGPWAMAPSSTILGTSTQ